MVEAKVIGASRLAEIFKPTYVEIPSDWQKGGTRGIVDKRGNPYTLVNYYTPDNLKVSFFADKLAEMENGSIAVEAVHYNEQMQRAKDYAAKKN